MAKVVKRELPYRNFPVLKGFIDSFNNPLVTTSLIPSTHNVGEQDLLLTFEDKGTATIYRDQNSFAVAYDFGKGISFDYWVRGSESGYFPFTICSSPDLFHMQFTFDNWGNLATFVLIYKKVSDSSTLVGIAGYYSAYRLYLIDDSLTFREVETGISYTYGKPLNYSASVNRIQYMDHTIILNGNEKVYNDSDLLACTTVTPFSVYTFNSQNYYALGKNTLIPIDLESDNG